MSRPLARVPALLGNILFKRYDGKTRWISNPLAESERRPGEERPKQLGGSR